VRTVESLGLNGPVIAHQKQVRLDRKYVLGDRLLRVHRDRSATEQSEGHSDQNDNLPHGVLPFGVSLTTAAAAGIGHHLIRGNNCHGRRSSGDCKGQDK
jgi:hypothetical protein